MIVRATVAILALLGLAASSARASAGMTWVYGRKLRVVDAAAGPDAVVDVTYFRAPEAL